MSATSFTHKTRNLPVAVGTAAAAGDRDRERGWRFGRTARCGLPAAVREARERHRYGHRRQFGDLVEVMTAIQFLRRGAGSMRNTSRVPSPTAAGAIARRFTFAFQDSPRREGQAKRREAIAEYVDGWAGAEIVAERRERDTLRCYVTFTTVRAVAVEVAEQFIRECPHVVRGTFEAVGERWLRQPIGRRGDHGAACHRTRLIGGEKCR